VVVGNPPPASLYFKLFQKLKVTKLDSHTTKPNVNSKGLKEGQISKHGDKLRKVVKRKRKTQNNVSIIGVNRKHKEYPENI